MWVSCHPLALNHRTRAGRHLHLPHAQALDFGLEALARLEPSTPEVIPYLDCADTLLWLKPLLKRLLELDGSGFASRFLGAIAQLSVFVPTPAIQLITDADAADE